MLQHEIKCLSNSELVEVVKRKEDGAHTSPADL